LWWAASEGRTNVVEVLLQAGADASLCNSEGCSPMRAAVEGRHLQVVVLLAPHGADAADINRIWFGRTTLLCIAAEEGRNELVEALLQAGANVNTSDADGKSPLWWAACKGHTEVMEVLLTHGADVDSPDEVRASPIALQPCNQLWQLMSGFWKVLCSVRRGRFANPLSRSQYSSLDHARLLCKRRAVASPLSQRGESSDQRMVCGELNAVRGASCGSCQQEQPPRGGQVVGRPRCQATIHLRRSIAVGVWRTIAVGVWRTIAVGIWRTIAVGVWRTIAVGGLISNAPASG
jgi:ankyrin repeat protein